MTIEEFSHSSKWCLEIIELESFIIIALINSSATVNLEYRFSTTASEILNRDVNYLKGNLSNFQKNMFTYFVKKRETFFERFLSMKPLVFSYAYRIGNNFVLLKSNKILFVNNYLSRDTATFPEPQVMTAGSCCS